MSLLTALAVVGGATPFNPESLYGDVVGDWWETGDLSTLFQDSAGTVPVAADGDVVGRWNGKRGVWIVSQGTTGSKPIWTDAEKAIACYDGKYLTNDCLIADVGMTTDATLFMHYRRQGAISVGNTGYLGVSRYNTYGKNFGMFNGATAVCDSTSEPFDVPIPDLTIFHSFAISANGNGYYNADPTPRLNPDLGPVVRAAGAGDFLLSYTDQAGRTYYMKMALLIRRVLTTDEIANLDAYARALP